MAVKIAHISDIHFRSLKRHDEYKNVFKEMFLILEKEKVDLIFIGGDIVHSKTQGITPEIIDLLAWWLTSLANVAPTHVILGNHDGLILNKDRQDAITPIVKALNNPNIYLYKDSGTYYSGFENINWCVFSCFDEDNWSNVKPIKGDINIACFHGAVYKSKTDTNWEIEGEVNVSMFDNYDFGFLGDIHMVQYLDEENRIAYPGSTIQQNYGEDIKKGFLLWEINNKNDFSSKFISINNPHPFITVDWRGSVENTIRFCEKIKKKARIRIRSDREISQAEIKLLHYYLKNDRQSCEIVYQVLNKDDDTNTCTVESQNNKNLNLRNKNDRRLLLKGYYNDIDDNTLTSLDNLFKEMLDKVPETLTDSIGNKWSLNYMKFDNTFAYGKNNYINFDSLNGVVGLFGNNRVGKSSIPGTMMYSLFNSSDRGAIKNKDIVNIRKGYCSASVGITTHNTSYEVTRETYKKTSKAGKTSATTKLYLKNQNIQGIEHDESEEQRRETEKSIRKIIGTAEDFLYTTFASQGEINTFIKEKNSARKTVLSKFLNLDLYENLYKLSREEYIVLKSNLNSKSKKNWSILVESFNKEQEANLESRYEIEKQLSFLRKKELELKIKQKEINSLDNHSSGHNLSSVKKEINYNVSLLEKNNNVIVENENKLLELKVKLEKINKFKNSYNLEDLKREKQKLEVLNNKLLDFKKNKIFLIKEKDNCNNELKILDQVPCENKFLSCKFIKKAHESKVVIPEIEEKIKEIETSVYEVRNAVVRLETQNIEEKITKYNEVINKEYKIEVDIEKYRNSKSLYKEKNKDIEISLNRLKDIKEEISLKHKKEDINNLQLLKLNLQEVSNEIYDNERKIRNIQLKEFEIKNEIVSLEKEKEEYEKLIQKWKIYDLFSSSVSKKGIPTMLINSYLPMINKEIQKILNNVTNFNIVIEDENNNLNVYIDYGDSKRIIECASGMEKMMASIAIRVSLINISALPKSDIFIIDEGFGSLDETNVEACSRLLSSLKKYFKTILIISHVDSIKDIVDKNIEVSVKEKDSYVYIK
jgi:DNA repair exonuclease SbcCD ATPase subunit/predicted phosphodiesterase